MTSPIDTSSLPLVDRSALPADIRKASTEDQQAFRAALGFEQTLVKQMLSSVESLSEAGGEDTPAAYKDLIPTTLAEAMSSQGGLGLARSLYESMRGESATDSEPSGGSAA
ncbi:MAG TPA: rod-binding protein [Thermoleophilaceae bacterium]